MMAIIPPLWVTLAGADTQIINPAELNELCIQQRLGLPALCELSFETIPQAVEDIAVGWSLQVSIQDSTQLLFSGDVTTVEYIYPVGKAPALRVRGYDPLHRLRKRQHVRAYVDCNLHGLLKNLVGNGALLVGDDLSWNLLIQHQQTDLEFLAEQAALAGCYPLARGEQIYLAPLSGLAGLEEYALDYAHNLYEARIEVNADGDCSEVAVDAWECATSAEIHVRARTANTGRQVEIQADAAVAGGLGARWLVNQGLENERQARALAQAELARRKAGRVVLWGRAEGSPDLQPGTRVRLNGVAGAVAGSYILTSVTHSYDYQYGYTVEFSSEPPQDPPRSRSDVATLGEVFDVNDPQNKGRVRARLPGYHSVETAWMPVVCPGAGREKGLVTLPDPGDLVLVLLLRENPAQGIVLGGLYGPEKTPEDCTNRKGARRYTWATQDGQRIRLDQDENLVLIENSAGAGIELKGNEIIIRAGKIDFRRS